MLRCPSIIWVVSRNEARHEIDLASFLFGHPKLGMEFAY